MDPVILKRLQPTHTYLEMLHHHHLCHVKLQIWIEENIVHDTFLLMGIGEVIQVSGLSQ